MRKLSIDNIQFIEIYLKNSGINFVDIRMEMTDHIASSIETEIDKGDSRDFYYIFKDYMALNKQSLLKRYDKYYRVIDLKILKQIFKKALSLKGILILLTCLFLIMLLQGLMAKGDFYKLIKNLPLVVVFIIAGIYFFAIRSKSEKYSSVERIGSNLLFIYYFSYFLFSRFDNLELINFNLYSIIIPSVILIWLNVIILIFAFEMKKKYDLMFTQKTT